MKVVCIFAVIAFILAVAAKAEVEYVFAELVESFETKPTAVAKPASSAATSAVKPDVKPASNSTAKPVVASAAKADAKAAAKTVAKAAAKTDAKAAAKTDVKPAANSTAKSVPKPTGPPPPAKKTVKKALAKVVAANAAIKKDTKKAKTAISDAKTASKKVQELKKKLVAAEKKEKKTEAKVTKINAKIDKKKAEKSKAKDQSKGETQVCPAAAGPERTECLKNLRVKVRDHAKGASRNATVAVVASNLGLKNDVILASEQNFEVKRACEDTPTSAKCLAAQKKYAESLNKIKKESEKALTVIGKAVTGSAKAKEAITKINSKVEASKLVKPKKEDAKDGKDSKEDKEAAADKKKTY